jgi:hypothetical protein
VSDYTAAAVLAADSSKSVAICCQATEASINDIRAELNSGGSIAKSSIAVIVRLLVYIPVIVLLAASVAVQEVLLAPKIEVNISWIAATCVHRPDTGRRAL